MKERVRKKYVEKLELPLTHICGREIPHKIGVISEINRYGKRNLKKNVEKLELSVTSYYMTMTKEILKKISRNEF